MNHVCEALGSERWEWEAVMAALYLRGLSRPIEVRRAGWRAVESVLRSTGVSIAGLHRELARAGLEAEALVLDTPGVLGEAERLVGGGRVLTCVSAAYPTRWHEVLGPGSPPALWVWGVPSLARPGVALVGSRQIGDEIARFSRRLGAEAAALGCTVLSGGAFGCDRAAVRGAAPHAVEILPRGLRAGNAGSVPQLSVCAPHETFSTAAAMERNNLIYAAADLAVVIHARFKAGGTWHGAVDAIRRRTTRVAVRWDGRDTAARALAGLGAERLGDPSELGALLQGQSRDARLF